ncbi:helix-turn-helix domain-containing protein [bacterium]|nr:helix-turn-helix domain-containing protein [bacterium]
MTERTLGERIRQARESRGLSLEAVGRETRLALSVLRALEEDRRADLPGDLYVANALRMLAELLELDRGELLSLYRAGQGISAPGSFGPSGRVWREEVPETRLGGWQPGRGLWLALGAVVVAGALLATALSVSRREAPPGRLAEPPAPAAVREAPAIDASLGPVEAPPPEEAIAKARADSVAAAAAWAQGPLALSDSGDVAMRSAPPARAALRLEVDAALPCRLELNVDDRLQLARALGAGDVWWVEADSFVVLSAASVSGLALRLNGSDYPLPAVPTGQPIALRLDAPVTVSAPGDG